MKKMMKVITGFSLLSVLVGCSDRSIEAKREGFAPWKQEHQDVSPEELNRDDSGLREGGAMEPTGRDPSTPPGTGAD